VDRAGSAVVSRPIAEHELSRILALVPWIVAHPARPKTEVAERFGISVEQLESDLDLVLMIGVPPYSPGDYLDVDDDGEFVTIRLADQFSRPLRLTPAEGLALLAAGRALLAVPGSDPEGPLATALGKLERALDLPEVVVAVGEPTFLEAVRDAAARGERVEIDYWSAGRDELTTRRIDPEVAFFAMGEWYLSAYCHRAEDERMFRVDRIRVFTPTCRLDASGHTIYWIDNVAPKDSDVKLDVKTPDSFAFSGAHRLNDQLELLADVTWWHWSKINQLPLIRTSGPSSGQTLDTLVLDLKDSWRFSAGANYKLSGPLLLKFGVAYDQTPVRSADARTVRLPDSDRYWLSAGLKYTVSKSGVLDVGYSYVKFKDADINNNQTALGRGIVNGTYEASVHVLGIQYQHTF